MTRLIRLTSVGTALDPKNLLTYPICSDGNILTVSSKPLQEYDHHWWAHLSSSDETVVHLAINAFEAQKWLMAIVGVDSVDFIQNDSLKNELESMKIKTDSIRKDENLKQCEEYIMTWGCSPNCPVLLMGQCSLKEESQRQLWNKTIQA